jgi:hypothetical protein
VKIAALVVCVLALLAPAAGAVLTVTPTVGGTLGSNGWYRSNVTVHWTWSDPGATRVMPVSGCGDALLTTDTPPSGSPFSCTVKSVVGSGNTTTTTTVTTDLTVHLDRTAPTSIRATTARAPDVAPWFNKPVGVTWSGVDTSSGVAVCTAITYAGPFLAGGPLTGTCTDRAGNVSAPVPFALDYDSVPPTIGGLAATPDVGRATLAWQAAGAASYTLQRTTIGRPRSTKVVYTGTIPSFTDGGLRVGRRYTFRLTATDPAGNAATASMKVALTELVAPAAGASVTLPTLLRWNPVSRADYYNVQLFRDGHKILSRWPRDHRLQLPQRWRFAGRTRHLRPGTYRWFVWPGIGPRSRNHYGRVLGTRSFTVLES